MKDIEQTQELIDIDKKNLWHHITQHKIFEYKEPFIIAEGKGCRIKDIHGREFLDAVSGGVWCVNAGYGQESIAKAAYRQLVRLPYYSGSAGNPPAILLAQKLSQMIPELSRVYFSSSGSEANEKAFKLARQYNRLKYKMNKYKILYRERDYHGTTLAALSATGQAERTEAYGPFVPGFKSIPAAYCYRCPFGKKYPSCDIQCAHVLEKVIRQENPDTVGALILEPITAGGGIIIPVAEYFEIIQKICRKYAVLLIIDEVVTGFGRTGKAFGHFHWGVRPDIVTTAKGITSSYMPLSATMATEKIFNEFISGSADKTGYFRDISTFGGSAGACAAALENIKIMQEQQLFVNSEKMGAYLLEKLNEFRDMPIIGDIRGKGLFVGIELVSDRKSKMPINEACMAAIVNKAAQCGVLIGKMNRSIPGQNNVLVLAPALVVNKDEIDKIVSAVHNALAEIRV
ncbi:aminotransferase [Pectinatus haikarae]|uniref:aminotransferase n=1 Tax=Pectinatus haikarae TaxID=349096 RepID=UPI0018C7B336|nr:aminotransferase [Pectinatus haikarae]